MKNKQFSFSLTISPSSHEYLELDNPEQEDSLGAKTEDYAPLRNITLSNTGNAAMKVYFNDQRGYKYVPAGTILDLSDREISSLKIENSDATNTATAELTLDNDETVLSTLRNILAEVMQG